MDFCLASQTDIRCVSINTLYIYVNYLYGRLWQQYIRLVQSCKEVL